MSDYRRYFVPGGTYFFTIVTYKRRPLFSNLSNLRLLRESIAQVKQEMPFDFNAAVVLPDHMHFIWSLPPGDDNYSKRIGKMKVAYTKRLRVLGHTGNDTSVRSASRVKHRESDIWQRRFWEHTIENEDELELLFNYMHYNPVKHGVATCPHAWLASSFDRFVKLGHYDATWGCQCGQKPFKKSDLSTTLAKFATIGHCTGE